MFQAVLTAATQDGDMAAAKLLIDRVIPSRRGAPVSFQSRLPKTPEDCALAYADLLDDVGAGRLTPDEAQTISAIVSRRVKLFWMPPPPSNWRDEIDALKAQLAARWRGKQVRLRAAAHEHKALDREREQSCVDLRDVGCTTGTLAQREIVQPVIAQADLAAERKPSRPSTAACRKAWVASTIAARQTCFWSAPCGTPRWLGAGRGPRRSHRR